MAKINMVTFSRVAKHVEKATIDNSPTILSVIGVVGTIYTALLTGKATFKAAEIIRDHEWEPLAADRTKASTKERIGLVWKLYIPATGSGIATVACIIGANRIGTRRAAAMAAAYSLSEKAIGEYKDKVIEKIGDKKEQGIRDDLAQDRVNGNPIGNRQVILTGNGDVLFYDSLSKRYFQCDVETIRKAVNDINYQMVHDMYANLSDFYILIGLPTTVYSDEVGWSSAQLLEVGFSTTLTDDNRPCIVIDYEVAPTRGYNRQL